MSQARPISPSLRTNNYTSATNQTAFPGTFPILLAEDVLVLTSADNGATWAIVAPADYVINGITATGFTLTFDAGQAAGTRVRILGFAPIYNGSDFSPGNTVKRAGLNDKLDRLTIYDQERERDFRRTIRTRPGEEGLEIPLDGSAANTLLGINADNAFYFAQPNSVGQGFLTQGGNLADLADAEAALDNLSFDPGYTHSVPRSLRALHRDWVSITSYDVSKAGVDSTANLQFAISESAAALKKLIFPQGAYAASALTIPSNAALIGEHRDTTALVSSSATADFINFASFSRLSGLTIGHALPRTAGKTLNIGNAVEVTLEDLTISAPFMGIYAGPSCGRLRARGINIFEMVLTTGCGMQIDGGIDMVMQNIDILRRTAGYADTCLRINNVADLDLTTFFFGGAQILLALTPGSGQAVISFKGAKGWLDQAGQFGAFVRPSGNAAVVRSDITETWLASSLNAGAYIEAGLTYPASRVEGFDLINCDIYDNDGPGIAYAGAGVKRCAAALNRIAGNGVGVSVSDASEISVASHIGPYGDFGANGIGVQLRGTVSNLPDKLDFSGSTIRGNTTQIDIDATVAGTDIRFLNTAGYDATITPAQITANQNDYNPTGAMAANILRISSDAARDITGRKAPGYAKQELWVNIGAQPWTLKNGPTASVDANEFAFSGDVTVAPGQAVRIVYDTTSAKWRLASLSLTSTDVLPASYLDTDGTLAANSDTRIASQKATKTYADARETAAKAYADSLVVGLLDDRGSYDASSNLFPATGGSGAAGAILKGDLWIISVAGTLGGVAVNIGDQVRALTNTPAQTAANWAVVEANIGYVPLNKASNLSDLASAATARTNLGLVAIAASGSATDLSAGTVAAARMPALTGDVTTSAGAVSTTIANDAVTNAKAANMATATIKGRTTAGTGDPEDLTVAQLAAMFTLPTVQTFPSGSGNWSRPSASCIAIRVRGVAGGGGGAGSGTSGNTSGGFGGNTTFSTLTANGGGGGSTTGAGGTGGTATGGSINSPGGDGQGATGGVANTAGGNGGASFFGGNGGGGPSGTASTAGKTNTGGGGGGAGGGATGSVGGGAAGGYFEGWILNPGATLAYAVGAAGAAGAAGASGLAGAAGGSGFIIVEELYGP